jgi:superfamily II DNA/RNA helicase
VVGSIGPVVLEAIATTFALDVPKIALLVLPATAPVNAVLKELHELGINAQSLGLQDEDRGKQELMRSTLKKFNPRLKAGSVGPGPDDPRAEEPSLLVTTEASIRGLDLPELSHVFIARVPDNEVDYSHVAGRVGRFGREGKVVLFLEGKERDKAAALYGGLKISLAQFEHVQA